MTGGRIRHERADVLRPGIRTYKPRRTRITARQSSALVAQADFLIPLESARIDLSSIWGAGVPVVMEIGFGSGRTTARMAADDPATGLLAIDIHTPGIGDLLSRIREERLANVRVMEADALVVLSRMIPPHSLAGVRSYFPDPWPKSRHHKRRLVQPPVLDLIGSRLVEGGWWHLATDWAAYAAAISACFAADPGWEGGRVPRPDWRPETPYEHRALREGRAVVDLRFSTVTPTGPRDHPIP